MNALEKKSLSIYELLEPLYPDTRPLLDYTNGFELIIAVILSAQCTDAMVNKVSPRLFSLYPNPDALKIAPINFVEEIIHSLGFYHTKAKNIIACAELLSTKYKNEIPESMDELISLPGVGRKTANVVRGALWNKNGIIVDTHFKRVVTRLGLTKEESPEKIESAIMKLLPEEKQLRFSHAINRHGRAVCKARKPLCTACVLESICPSKMY